ncbi:hypothetical protein HOA91_00870 [Candidatus Woesearchaeota archaeon]|jgi:chromosome segregation ATPase|nr:hypothetical protein [Candidatus Woesearchaeota archaeon]
MAKIMKKMFALAVLAIFMLSIVPAALAEEVADGATEQEPLKATKEPGKQAKKVLADTKNGLKLTRERLRLLKTKHLEAKEKFQEQKQNVLRIRDRVKACQEDSEECQKNKKDLKVGVKNHLVKTSDLILRSLEKLVDQIENAKNLTDEEKEEALAKVTSMEEELTAKKAELEALGSEVTAEEIRAGIKELKELWNRIRKEQRWIVTQLINNKMGNVVDKHDEFYNAMEMRISGLEEKGVSEADLEAVKRIADKFKEAVEQLKADQEEAEEAWANAKSDPDALELAKEKQKVVREDMKATKDLLREFVKAFNEAKPKKEYLGEETEE